VEAQEILALFDDEMRRRPPAIPGAQIEDHGRIVRIIGDESVIIYSDLGSVNARDVVTGQTDYFRAIGREVEWKVYGHDKPPDLSDLLREADYTPDPPETLMVWELNQLPPVSPRPSDVTVRQVRDEASLRAAVNVSEDAFGRGEGWGSSFDRASLLDDPGFAAFVAYRAGVPVASGRLEMPPGRSFASLWGGGTAPEHRGLGIYRDLVSHRAQLARSRGYKFLTVDARESSRPILERLGFRPLDTITGWVLKLPTNGSP
jgi:GNAT superfamily N-acetyltransferase